MPTTPASYETKDLKKLKVADLRAILEAKGADSTGKKDELIAKIQASEGPSDEPAPEPSPEPAPEPKKSPPAKKAKAAKSPPAKKPKKATPTEDPKDDDEPRPVNNFFFNKEVAAHDSSSDDEDDDDDERPEPEPEPEEPAVEEEPEPPADAADTEIYVGFLGDNCDRKFIAELFSPYFEVTRVHMPMQSEPGGGAKRPKGYAFVTVPRHADPAVAIEALDQSETFPGAKHPLKVSLAKKNDVWANRDRDDDRSGTKRRRDDRGDTRGGNKGGVPPGKSPERLYILGLPTRITEVLLKEVYSQFGSVVDARVLRSRDGEEGGPKRGQVTFAAASDAAKAKAATDNTRAFHGGGELRVVYANLREGETRKDGGGARARQGTAMQPWQVYPMQPGIPLYTPMVPVMVDPDTGQPIVPRTRPIVNDEGGKKAPESGKSAAGYTGIHLAGLPPSATVDAKYAHLYQ